MMSVLAIDDSLANWISYNPKRVSKFRSKNDYGKVTEVKRNYVQGRSNLALSKSEVAVKHMTNISKNKRHYECEIFNNTYLELLLKKGNFEEYQLCINGQLLK